VRRCSRGDSVAVLFEASTARDTRGDSVRGDNVAAEFASLGVSTAAVAAVVAASAASAAAIVAHAHAL
jgi:hypothetical protein